MTTLYEPREDFRVKVRPDEEPVERAGATVRVGYLLSRYPAISHTFFLHEVLGLRARGMHVETASVNRPDRPTADLPEAEAAEAARTFYLKGGRTLRRARMLILTALGDPLVVARGLLAVAGMPRLTLRRRLFWLLYLAEALLVGRWMRRKQLTHLHVHFGGAVASVGMLTARAWRVPFSMTIHGPEELLNVDAYHLREKVKAAEFVFCVSDFCRSQICQWTDPADWKKFSVARLGVDPMMLAPVPRAVAMQGDGPMELVCTGRLVPAKGHTVLLEALGLLKDRGIAVHATLIGGGPEEAGLRAQALRLGIGDRVRFTGALNHQATLAEVQKADVFTLASFAEGIPVALMEAMGLGVPCVSTTVAGIPELIQTGQNGMLVAPGNAEALAGALETLASDPALRRRLGGAGRQKILSDYNLGLNQERLVAEFSERLGRRRVRRRVGEGAA